MEKVYEKEKNCCGCGACAKACPREAIEMLPNEKGFIFPKIDSSKCINCGLCKRICNFNNIVKSRNDYESYAVVSKDDNILLKSASGGAFSSLAKHFIELGGIVYGSSLEYEENKIVVKHIGIENIEDLKKIQGSKYVQSNAYDIFKEIKEKLDNNREVLFSGTPCQVNGLKQYLKKEYENLFTVDLICHGVPNLQILNDYIKTIEKKKKIKVVNISFRDKSNGWGMNGSYEYFNKHGKKIKNVLYKDESSYYYYFLKGLFYRESCYHCPFASDKRAGDITIGDYWGIEKEHPELLKRINKYKGISCLILNNEKGKKIIKKFGKYLELYESTFKQIQQNNGQLNNHVNKPAEYEKIMEKYVTNGYVALEKEYEKKLGYRLYVNKIISRIKIFIKRIIFKLK